MDPQLQYEQIEAYLGGELSGGALAAFEQRLRSDASFASEVALHREMAKALGEQDVMNLENLLKEIRQEGEAAVLVKANAAPSSGTKIVSMRRRYLAIAASVALLVVAGLVLRNFMASTADHFTAFYEPYPVYLNTRNADAERIQALENGIKSYSEKDFATAVPSFQAVLKADPGNLDVLFYLAICQLETGDLAAAEAAFQQVASDGNSLYAGPAEWYHALVLLKLGRTVEAKSALEAIVKSQGDFAKKAAELLGQL